MKSKKYFKKQNHKKAKKIGYNIAKAFYFVTCMSMIACFYYMMYELIMAI